MAGSLKPENGVQVSHGFLGLCKPVVLKVRSSEQHHQLGGCREHKFSGPTPDLTVESQTGSVHQNHLKSLVEHRAEPDHWALAPEFVIGKSGVKAENLHF